MARPARKLWVTRTYARRRHRLWMHSMVLATLGWGTWWVVFFLRRLAPGLVPPLGVVGTISLLFAIPGLIIALLTFRARTSWLIFAHVPLFANASLLVMPWLEAELWGPQE
jgi:hypothetical protein